MSTKTKQLMLRADDPLIDLAERVGRSGTWRAVPASGELSCSAGMYRILGLDPDGPPPSLSAVLALVAHPDNHLLSDQADFGPIHKGVRWSAEAPVLGADGVMRWVRTDAVPQVDVAGRVVEVLGFAQDLTEKHNAEQELAEAEDSFRATFEQAAVGIAHVAPDGTWIRVNQRLCDMLGYTQREMMQLRFAALTHPDDVGASMEALRAMRTGEIDTYDAEKRYFRKDGSMIWANLSVSAVRDGAGQFEYLVSVIEDISDRNKAQAALELSEAKFASAFLASPDAVNINRLTDGLFFDVNDGFTEMTGYSAAEVVGRTSAEISIWADPAQREQLVAGLLASGAVHNHEARFRRKDGTVITGLMSARVLRVNDEQCILSVTRDISERKAIDDALKEQSEMVRLLLDSTVEAIHGLDAEGRFTFCNAASLRMLGYEGDEMLGQPAHEMIHHSHADGTPYPRSECAVIHGLGTGEETHSDDEVFWRADGTSFPVECWSHPLFKDGAAVGSVVTFVDITERRRLEAAIERRLIALTQPPVSASGLTFRELFEVDEIQAIQDAFSAATGVASLIVEPDGTPITRPSNFCRLCSEVIRGTTKGLANCRESDVEIGRCNPSGPVVRHCLSGGLWDAGASINAGGTHIASWLVGQVRDETQDDADLLKYADEIGADPDDFASALAEVPIMSPEQFERIAHALFVFANELSVVAYQNVQQARFITEQKRVEAEVRALNEDLEHRGDERLVLLKRLAEMVTSIIDVLDNVSEMRDPYTAGHQRRVAEIASAIAGEMGCSEDEIADIHVAGLMHDIGKIAIPVEILSKPTALSPTEFLLIKAHSEAGYSIISSAHMRDPIAELVYQHHERCDGSGYPRGLTGDQLLDAAKVLMVADVVEAMMSHRPYRAALGQEAALAEIEQGAGRLYDLDVADACLRLFREKGFELAVV